MIRTVKGFTIFISLTVIIAGLCFAFQPRKVEILSVSGDVKVLPEGKTDWINGRLSMVLRPGDRIKTGAASSCELSFDKWNENIIGILENSDVIILLKGNEKIEIINAEIFGRLKAIRKGTSFEIKTPIAVCGARGTGLGVKADNENAKATAFEDDIYIKNNKGEKKDIKEGFSRGVDKTGKISKGMEAKQKDKEKFKKWDKKANNLARSNSGAKQRRVDALTGNIEKMMDKAFDKNENKIREKNEDDRSSSERCSPGQQG